MPKCIIKVWLAERKNLFWLKLIQCFS